EKLLSAPCYVVHFMGHGGFDDATGEGCLILEDERGGAVRLPGRTLGKMLKVRRDLGLVVLNACDTARLPRRRGQDPFAGVASARLMAGIPAVVAMQFPISDEAALAFSGRFYAALGQGLPFDAAAALGRLAIATQRSDSWEWVTPALFMGDPEVGGGPERSLDRRQLLAWVGAALAGAALVAWLVWAVLPHGACPHRGVPRIEAAEAARHVD